MKVWELEEGKEYTSNLCDDGTIYKLIDGDLHYKHPKLNYNDYSFSGMEYNRVKTVYFTEYSPPTDWSKVEVDTKVLVSGFGEECKHRHFAKYEHGKVYAWFEGKTSFTSNGEGDISSWSYAKLYTE